MDQLIRAKLGYAAGVAFALFFLLLGVASLWYFFGYVYNGGPDANSTFGFRYILAGLSLIIVGSIILTQTVPAFIPLKQPYRRPPEVCPLCGAVVEADWAVCEKCKQPFDVADES
jgi:hypothetical protein